MRDKVDGWPKVPRTDFAIRVPRRP